MQGKKLYRSKKKRIIGGVCGGLGDYFGIDPNIIRLLLVVITFFGYILPGVLVYIVACLFIPEENDEDGSTIDADYEYKN